MPNSATSWKLPSHLHSAYGWMDEAGQLDELRRLDGYALEAYCQDSAQNADRHGDCTVHVDDLMELGEWLRRCGAR